MEFISQLSEWGYIGLFLVAFIAGSVFPLSSEVVMGLLLSGGYSLWGCVVSATLGNWLGGMSCYYVGYLGRIEWIERYLGISHEKLDRMQRFLQGRGAVMAFFVFLPVVGDVLVVALGLMRANLTLVSISMFVGKALRYIVMAYGFHQLFAWLNI